LYGYQKKQWIYGLILAQGEWLPHLPKAGRYGPMVELGTVLSLSNRFTLMARLRFASELNRPFDRAWRWESDAKLGWNIQENFQIRAGLRAAGSGWLEKSALPEWVSELRWYY